MKLLFVADGRSPIALNWIAYFVDQGHEVHLVSTFPCEPALQFASLNHVPVAFSQVKGRSDKGKGIGDKGDLSLNPFSSFLGTSPVGKGL